ncbi:hypothetical protein J437_LFUL003434 [Ladona fulva]|uniref:Lipase domain-containing protein n=1 Tax=Ladona fulva TaxID=123851 RepID=A0A8K0K1A2_LADFU|nr:hypothetical protein J437_LFUL003434 [Ladona fulva]
MNGPVLGEGQSLTQRGGVNIGGFFFTLFPKLVSPNGSSRSIKEDNIVNFHLFLSEQATSRGRSRQNRKKYKTLDPKKMDEYVASFNISLPTMIFVHGFQETNNAIAINGLLSAVSRSGRWNVVVVDWHQLSAGPWYPWALYNIQATGRFVANFIDSLGTAIEEQSYNEVRRRGRSDFLENLHIVGFSLGAHVAGIAGHHVTIGKVGRITGLDPAYPLVELLGSKNNLLDESDAQFVDVIHTGGGVFGTPYKMGHADFFPNGGRGVQPGCESLPFPHICSHWRAWRFFAESLLDERSFESLPCDSWEKFKRGDCDSSMNDAVNGTVYMGVGARNTARGRYYLRTYPTPPFSMPL